MDSRNPEGGLGMYETDMTVFFCQGNSLDRFFHVVHLSLEVVCLGCDGIQNDTAVCLRLSGITLHRMLLECKARGLGSFQVNLQY